MAEFAPVDPLSAPEPRLKELGRSMSRALTFRRDGQNGKATALLQQILKEEPRLAEPRLELSWIAAEREDWEEAQAQARLAVEILDAGGQWTDDMPPERLLSFALTLLGEVLVRPLEEGDLFLVDRAGFTAGWNEAAALFARAAELDPESDDARRNRSRYRPIDE